MSEEQAFWLLEVLCDRLLVSASTVSRLRSYHLSADMLLRFHSLATTRAYALSDCPS